MALAGQVLRVNQALEAADADGAYTVLVERQAYSLRFEDSAEGLSLHVDGPEPGSAQFGADVRDWRAVSGSTAARWVAERWCCRPAGAGWCGQCRMGGGR